MMRSLCYFFSLSSLSLFFSMIFWTEQLISCSFAFSSIDHSYLGCDCSDIASKRSISRCTVFYFYFVVVAVCWGTSTYGKYIYRFGFSSFIFNFFLDLLCISVCVFVMNKNSAVISFKSNLFPLSINTIFNILLLNPMVF